MKKQTVILAVVVAFLVGFISGATVAILKKNSGKTVSAARKPQMPPQAVPEPAPGELSPTEAASKIQALKDIVKKDPKNLSALEELGNLYFDSNQPKEAIDAYNQYLALKPDNADVRTDLGIMYRKVGQFDKAIDEFRKAGKIDPKHLNSRYNIGLVLLHDKQDIKGAIQAFEEYVKVDPNSERGQRLKGQIEKMKTMVK